MNEPQMAALLVSHGRPGFYFRVLEEGQVGAGDEIVKVKAAPERVTVAEINAAVIFAGSPGRAWSCGPSQRRHRYHPALLILFRKNLGVGFAIRVEQVLAALLPRLFQLWRCNVPVRPAFLENGTQVLAELLQRRPPKEPIAIVDLVNDKTRFKHDHMGDHGIVIGVGIFRYVEILLDDAPGVRKERPMGTDPAAIFIRLDDVISADCNKAAIGNLELTMEFNKPFGLPTVLGTVSSATEDENHRMLSLEVREHSPRPPVVGKLVVR
jgi:hypothetical protein